MAVYDKASLKVSKPINTSFSLMVYYLVLIFLLLPHSPVLRSMILTLNIHPFWSSFIFQLNFVKSVFHFPVFVLNYFTQYMKNIILKPKSVTSLLFSFSPGFPHSLNINGP